MEIVPSRKTLDDFFYNLHNFERSYFILKFDFIEEIFRQYNKFTLYEVFIIGIGM